MTCKHLNKEHERKLACKIRGGVCLNWIEWFENNKRSVTDRDDFCAEVPDDFDPDII